MMIKLFQFVFKFLKDKDPEQANKFSLYALLVMGLKEASKPKFPSLEQNVWKRNFATPVGLAAGFDKDALAVSGHFHLGFGFVELGTVTPLPQEGNPKPRIFKDDKTKSAINRMGFPSVGAVKFGQNLGRFFLNYDDHWGRIGVNIGMNANSDDPVNDYRECMRQLGDMADYIVLNLSSPNTKGLCRLQNPDALVPILEAVTEEREKFHKALPALLVKLSPDLDMSMVEPLSKLLLEHQVNGIILANTTVSRPEVLDSGFASEAGGLSGALLQDKSNKLIRAFYKHLRGRVVIVGSGGINDAKSAYDKIKAGAHLVQLYTALAFEGPALVSRINKDLAALVKQDGYDSIGEAVGADYKAEILTDEALSGGA